MVLTEAGFDPDDRRRRAGPHPRDQRAPRQGRVPRRRGRRVRPVVSRADAGRRRDHEHRGRSPRHLPRPGGHPRRLRDVRQPRPVLRLGRRLRRRSRRAEPAAEDQAARRDVRRVAARRMLRRATSAWRRQATTFEVWDAGAGTARRRPPAAARAGTTCANALAAIAVGRELLIPFETIARALGGLHRRRPPLREEGRARRACSSSTTTRTIRRRSRPRSRRAPGLSRPPPRGALPAAPLLADARLRDGVRPGAARRGRHRRHGRLSVAREADARRDGTGRDEVNPDRPGCPPPEG